jgi:hypothetical protein
MPARRLRRLPDEAPVRWLCGRIVAMRLYRRRLSGGSVPHVNKGHNFTVAPNRKSHRWQGERLLFESIPAGNIRLLEKHLTWTKII